MRQSKAVLAVVAVLVAAMSFPVLARGKGGGGHGRSGASGHSHRAGSGAHAPRRVFAGPRIGFFLGAPLYAPLYYAPAPVYYIAPPAPVYIEKTPADPDAMDFQYWYYCPGSDTYFPYVKECPGGWHQVVPEPPATAREPAGY